VVDDRREAVVRADRQEVRRELVALISMLVSRYGSPHSSSMMLAFQMFGVGN
jgi:hypothetical protein